MGFNAFVKRHAYWFNDWRRGGIVRKGFDDIEAVLGNYETGRRIQRQRLHDLLSYASSHTRFYREYAGKEDDLSQWPVLNKTDFIEHYDAHCVVEGDIPGQDGRPVHLQKTGGSTGVSFAVPQDFLKRQRRISEIKWFNELNGFKSHEKLCHCRVWTQWQNKSKWQTFKENIYAFNVEHMGDDTIEELISLIERERIEVLRGYASWHRTLAEYFASGKGDPRRLSTLKLIISESDTLDERTRAIIEEYLDCPIIDSYGNEENGTFGYQRVDSTDFVLNHAGYVIEVLDFDEDRPVERGQMGRLVVTDLFNHAFPMIRYDTGDVCVLSDGEGEWPVMSKLFGRRLDIVYDTKGDPVQPMVFSRVLKNYPKIMQWQFAQVGETDYALRLCLRDGEDLEAIRKQMLATLGDDANVKFEMVDDIPVLRSGKKKPVVQEWEKRGR
ncbi:hypothetical protein C1878_03835 [Gordonibacter sp. 28C]|uniref:phenylacetate--CoA ligase family protein n=1 Tax=Gordonibacter sp. 28C TaxID=2078569 RepID=UPI000DF8685A|nr:phenylacetate--CoA ligase family protein [Gordonibacter sp. 28C]RDB63927.1 hypothetical protein C1878_03835 [Gordonibacter sp. 28C]